METYPVGLRLFGVTVSIEITDGHGKWSLGKQTTLGTDSVSPNPNGELVIAEKTNLSGPKITLQSEDTNSISMVVLLHVTTSLRTLTVKVVNTTGGVLVKVNGPHDEFIDHGTGTWTHVLHLS